MNRLLGSGAPGVGSRLEMRIQEAMDGEEMEQRKRERGHQWQQLGQWSSSGPRGGRGRVAASGGGVIVARDVGSKQEAAASPSAQTARASASLPRLGPC